MAKYNCPTCHKPCEDPRGCFSHKPRKPLKSGGKIAVKPRTAQQKMKTQIAIDRMWQLFLEVWEERGPYSEIDGAYLGKEPRSYMFDHLLPKETFPEVQYEKWNILMVTLDQHSNKHNGYPHPTHQEAINKAKEVYNNLFGNC